LDDINKRFKKTNWIKINEFKSLRSPIIKTHEELYGSIFEKRHSLPKEKKSQNRNSLKENILKLDLLKLKHT
jgi:hypothetical protein